MLYLQFNTAQHIDLKNQTADYEDQFIF